MLLSSAGAGHVFKGPPGDSSKSPCRGPELDAFSTGGVPRFNDTRLNGMYFATRSIVSDQSASIGLSEQECLAASFGTVLADLLGRASLEFGTDG